jgi:hypothetical protein
MVKLPSGALLLVVIVSVEVAVPFDNGVMGLGIVKVTPFGADVSHEPDNATAELNSFSERTATEAVALEPWVNVREDGAADREKSGAAT